MRFIQRLLANLAYIFEGKDRPSLFDLTLEQRLIVNYVWVYNKCLR